MLSNKILNYLLDFIIANLMAEFHDIFCRPFLLSVLIIEGVGGMGNGVGREGVGGVGGGKNHPLGHPMNSHDTHTVANDTLAGHIASRSKSRSPLPNWRPLWVPLF